MGNLNFRFRDKCVWWFCTLVALIPIAMVAWIIYMLFL